VLRLHLVQYASKLGDVEHNLDRLIDVMRRSCRGDGADLVVAPELYLPGYMARDLFFHVAEPVTGSTVARLALEARRNNCYVITGFAERDEITGSLYNTALIIGPRGVLGLYRKRHLPSYGVFDEARYFSRGKSGVAVVDVNGHRIGVGICYDAFYPEVSRIMMMRGAVVHVYISAAPDMSRDHFEVFTRARAMENTAYVVYVNTVGQYDGLGFFGGSHVVNPLGRVIAKLRYYEEDIATVELDPRDVINYRSHRPILKDLEPEDIELLHEGLTDLVNPKLPSIDDLTKRELKVTT